MTFDAQKIYEKVRRKDLKYIEETHCPMILEVMYNRNKGTISAFCVEAGISDSTFWRWTISFPVFGECYRIGKMHARQNWEDEGRNLETNPVTGQMLGFEYWRMVGWSRFGVGKNSRVRLNITPDATANVHYRELMAQAAEGDFTAGEIKQLVEAVNVGLNAHQVVALQQEIDDMKADLKVMGTNQDGKNINTTSGVA